MSKSDETKTLFWQAVRNWIVVNRKLEELGAGSTLAQANALAARQAVESFIVEDDEIINTDTLNSEEHQVASPKKTADILAMLTSFWKEGIISTQCYLMVVKDVAGAVD